MALTSRTKQFLTSALADRSASDEVESNLVPASSVLQLTSLPVTLALYVDATNGNDAFDGSTVGTAFKTIGRAQLEIARKFPAGLYSQNVQVNLKAGTYTETLRIGGQAFVDSTLSFVGVDTTTAVLASGVTSGTVASVATSTAAGAGGAKTTQVNVTSAGWTPGDVTTAKNIFLKVTSGSLSGTFIPVYKTIDANNLEIPHLDSQVSGLTGATFTLVTNAAIIKKATDSATAAVEIAVTSQAFDSGVVFQNVNFDGTGCSKLIRINGHAHFKYCGFDANASSSTLGSRAGGFASFQNCVGSVKSIIGGFTSGSHFNQIRLDGCAFTSTAFHTFQIDYPYMSLIFAGSQSIIEANGNSAVICPKASTAMAHVYVLSGLNVKNCDYFFKAENGGQGSVTLFNTYIQTARVNAIWITDDIIGAVGNWAIYLQSSTIAQCPGIATSNTGYGVLTSAPHTYIRLHSSNIHDCATGGVNIGLPTNTGHPAPTHNSLALSSMTMSSNGSSADISVDGSAFITYAAAVAAGRTSAASLFNTCYAT